MGDDAATGKVDGLFTKVQNYVAGAIGAFVAFLFLLIALGAFLALIVMQRWPEYAMLTVIVPGLAGVSAYYNRTIAIVLFILLLGLVFIL